jgi:transcription termination/antitermination protein NusA
MVVSELRGEKIDIIPYNDEPARFVAKALSPARVREVLVDDDDQQATVIVPDDQLSLAIGRDGQNARLAARLTGWRVDIKSETEFAREEDDIEYEGEEEFDGRCMAILSNGRRCPNAALGGSTYCGLPQHQSLARFDTNQVAVLSGLSDEEVATLANPDADEDAVKPIVDRASAAFAEAEAAEEPEAQAAEEGAEEEEAEVEQATEAVGEEQTEEEEAAEAQSAPAVEAEAEAEEDGEQQLDEAEQAAEQAEEGADKAADELEQASEEAESEAEDLEKVADQQQDGEVPQPVEKTTE